MTVADVLGSLRADSPVLLVIALAVLSAAAATARRVMASIRRQGERLGALETLASSERTRRRQVEAELLELGIPLPYWPDDPASGRELAVLRGRERRRHLEDQDHEDQDDDQRGAAATRDQTGAPLTTEATYAPPPVPSAAGARHSR